MTKYTDKFIPTTDQVRDGYAYDPEYEYHNPTDTGYVHFNRATFDRWLSKVKAEAWDEGAAAQAEAYDYYPTNPYRGSERVFTRR